jgi:hypothetical protein
VSGIQRPAALVGRPQLRPFYPRRIQFGVDHMLAPIIDSQSGRGSMIRLR